MRCPNGARAARIAVRASCSPSRWLSKMSRREIPSERCHATQSVVYWAVIGRGQPVGCNGPSVRARTRTGEVARLHAHNGQQPHLAACRVDGLCGAGPSKPLDINSYWRRGRLAQDVVVQAPPQGPSTKLRDTHASGLRNRRSAALNARALVEGAARRVAQPQTEGGGRLAIANLLGSGDALGRKLHLHARG